jgi:hypothetical protein
VYEKEGHAEAKAAGEEERGENWTHVTLDPEHRLVVEAMPGKRTAPADRPKRAEELVEAAARRTGRREDILLTSDDYKPYRKGVVKAYGKLVPRARRFRLGRSPKPRTVRRCGRTSERALLRRRGQERCAAARERRIG